MATIPPGYVPDFEMDDEMEDTIWETFLYINAGLPPVKAPTPPPFGTTASRPELPTELCEEILLMAWLDVPLFAPTHRWALFRNVSLVSRRLRQCALWVATRHVRVLAHCSMDIDAYRSIARQCLSLRAGENEKTFLDAPFSTSTVHLDVTYVTYWAINGRDRWLKDDITPGRPDDVYGVVFELYPGPFDAAEYSYPYPERREPEYLAWLDRRRRDTLSGWFADLLSAVPECTTAIISVDGFVSNSFCPLSYSMVLEALWWWKTLELVDFRVAARGPDFMTYISGRAGGPEPPLPALPSVRRVRMYKCPSCTCTTSRNHSAEGHDEECLTRRMLLPFPGLRELEIDLAPPRDLEIFVVPPHVEVVVGTTDVPTAEHMTQRGRTGVYGGITDSYPYGDEAPTKWWVSWLHISLSDDLWEILDPARFRSAQPELV
ncbi:hypothetical protein C8Q78DRAFT_1057123 [Trametes maxima]|nr:hypothetical protein C8Q78DRAFT_1057123 [Trametes maxima]